MARTPRKWSNVDIAMIDHFSQLREAAGNPSLRTLAGRLGMKHTRVGDLFNKTNGTPTLQEFVDLCEVFNVVPSVTLREIIAEAERLQRERDAIVAIPAPAAPDPGPVVDDDDAPLPDFYAMAAKHGDTEAEQEAYEEMP